MSRLRAIWAFVRRQHGVIAHRQLVAHGYTTDAIKHRLRTGRLHCLFRGVYAVGRAEVSRHGRWMAAALACGPVPHSATRAPAALWEIAPFRPARSTSRARQAATLVIPESASTAFQLAARTSPTTTTSPSPLRSPPSSTSRPSSAATPSRQRSTRPTRATSSTPESLRAALDRSGPPGAARAHPRPPHYRLRPRAPHLHAHRRPPPRAPTWASSLRPTLRYHPARRPARRATRPRSRFTTARCHDRPTSTSSIGLRRAAAWSSRPTACALPTPPRRSEVFENWTSRYSTTCTWFPHGSTKSRPRRDLGPGALHPRAGPCRRPPGRSGGRRRAPASGPRRAR